MLDVMIITYNERLNLPHCLAALQGWTGKVFVIDSGSTDSTPEIARAHGAQVVRHDWEGYARQKNWGLRNLDFGSEWILILDADEVVTPQLREHLTQIVAQPSAQRRENGFFINRLTYFMGRPLHHCGYFPSWNMRLIKRGKGFYEDREVHEHIVISDPVGYISEPILHDDKRGLEHYMAKHNRYSTLEARSLFQEIRQPAERDQANVPGSTQLRRWLKRHLLPHIPMPGTVRFFYMYILKLGFLDGRAGFEFCKFIGMYDALVALKFKELNRQASMPGFNLSPAPPQSGLVIPEGYQTTTEAVPVPADAATPAAQRFPTPTSTQDAIQKYVADTQAELQAAHGPKPMGRHPRTPALAAKVDPQRLPPGNWPALGSVPVSVLIPVKNEAANIVECLRHVRWANQIVVVDSQSTDITIPLAQAMGAEVYQFYYSASGWPKKKNWALENIAWQNEWVLILDADEHMTPALTQEVVEVVAGQYKPRNAEHAGCGDGYWLNRRFMFMGRWIKGCGYYPSYNVRLFKHRVGRYERIGALGDTGSGDNEVHEHIVLSTGPAGYLKHDFLHYAYPDLNTWIEKHNRYSNWEAHAMAAENKGLLQASPFGELMERRRWLKQVARHLPWRPTLRFVYSYILKRGFLDGYPGYVMSRLMAWYEFVSIAKYHEMGANKPSSDYKR